MKFDYFKECKRRLQDRRENTKYFNRDFFNTFCRCRKDRAAAIKNGIDDSYVLAGVLLFHSWDDVYKSNFYNKNSGCYCEFLSVFCEVVPV